MVSSRSPSIGKLKETVPLTEARALLYIAICEVCDFFNVGKNMNDVQVAMTVDLILESFCHLRLEEVKYCFRRAMRNEKVYDRLDGNVILGWLKDYEAERTEAAMQCSEEAERKQREAEASEGGISFEQYKEQLKQRAANGDKEAAERLSEIDKPISIGGKAVSRDEREHNKDEFRRFKAELIRHKHNGKTTTKRR